MHEGNDLLGCGVLRSHGVVDWDAAMKILEFQKDIEIILEQEDRSL